jgi:hypothetical protein
MMNIDFASAFLLLFIIGVVAGAGLIGLIWALVHFL